MTETEKPILLSARDDANSIFLYEFMIPVCLLAGSGIVISGFHDVYPQLFLICFGVIIGLSAIHFYLKLRKKDNLAIYANRIETTSLFGNIKKTILLNDIHDWNEFKKVEDRHSYLQLVLYTAQSDYRINSTDFRNYDAIKTLLIKDKPEKPAIKGSLLKGVLICAGFLATGIFFLYLLGKAPASAVPENQVETFNCIIDGPVVIENGKAEGTSIHIVGYPQFEFYADAHQIPLDRTRALCRILHSGDIVGLDLSREDINKKLRLVVPLSWADKMIDYHFIMLYRIRYQGEVFGNTDLSGSNNILTASQGFCLTIGLLTLIPGIIMLLVLMTHIKKTTV